ncbi:serine/threonine protein kinase [Actinoplanes sp. SE50]|uniref:serine/threonine-protein kinase n=1 Tax=unclassified Actinoplanes TaxID=2626549 RepID=UPI00023ED20C|nr:MULTISPECIES: serine/threonine-protein kinase [unclassified Actinoplanes]AEV83869.1 Serine/threonine protein kinase [Actinoplanes sp. SE50/110]ATO81987.1 serine/threonine protein kinase [Actinoplanes sp. SE50]SLL99395.1 serine/threonine protein kinase [Actinoplanes sp. SE50/110]
MADQEALGREYLLHEEIGRGALAVVRRATRRSGGPPLAAKLLHPELASDRRIRESFLREEAALRHLDHPGIVGFHDLVVEGGTLALLMDLVDGPDLRRHLAHRGGRLGAAETAVIVGQAAEAVAAAHRRGVVHLDLKPENLLVVRDTGPAVVRVTDFGLAVLLMDAARGVAGGTPGYTAPEIWQGATPTAAADVYSLGILLVELITGHVGGDPDALPERLAGPARSCLAPDPRDRPAAEQVGGYLRALVASGVLGPPPPVVAEGEAGDVPDPVSRRTTVRGAGSVGSPGAGGGAGAAVDPEHSGIWVGQLAGGVPLGGFLAGAPPQGGFLAGTPAQGGFLAGAPPQGRFLAGTPAQGGLLAGAPPQGGFLAGTPAQGGLLAGAPPRGGGGPRVPAAGLGGTGLVAEAPPRRREGRGMLVAAGVLAVVAAGMVGLGIAKVVGDRSHPAAAVPVSSAPAVTPSAGAGGVLPPTEQVRASASAAPVRVTLAGYAADDGGTLALSIRDGTAIAYICDGNTREAWLQGTAVDGRLALSGTGGARITGTFDALGATGKVTVAGGTHAFTLRPVQKPSGLYRTSAKVRGARIQGSWIVLPDGRQVGVLTDGGRTGPAPRFDVAGGTATVDGVAVAVTAVDVDSGAGF